MPCMAQRGPDTLEGAWGDRPEGLSITQGQGRAL